MSTRVDLVALVMIVAISGCAAPVAAASAKTAYTAALAGEEAFRAAVRRGEEPSLDRMRALVARYEAVVRRHPASAYSDNALWQAAVLAADAFDRFGEPRDTRAAIRLLRDLKTRYPSSSLVAKADQQLARLTALAAAAIPKSDLSLATIPVPVDLPIHTRAVPTTLVEPRPEPSPRDAREAGLETAPRKLITVRDVRRSVLPGVLRITVELDDEVAYHEERLAGPARMFLDLMGTRPATPLAERLLSFDADLANPVRIGKHPNNTTRVVVDLQGIIRYSVFPLYNPYRLVIDCERTIPLPASITTDLPLPAASLVTRRLSVAPAARGTKVAALNSIRRERRDGEGAAGVRPAEMKRATADARVSTPPIPSIPSPPVVVTSAPAAPTSNLRGGFSLSRQLGLGISCIVIDAGHGGHDPGAHGQGVEEAELVLDVALRLETLLLKESGVEVILTRRSDVYVPLEERTAIANREGADLFLSIHANASRNQRARGIETYFLNFASNPDAEAVAARENSASGRTMNNLPDIVKAIALNNKLDESRDFAAIVQQAMVQRLRSPNKALRDLGVKQAPFVVLIGAGMPSVLAEISFVTNPQEGQLLRSGAYRQRIAEALMSGITRYQRSLKAVRTIAHGESASRED